MRIMLECIWGRGISLPWDRDPCGARATYATVLHDPHHVVDGRQRVVTLCDVHAELVRHYTAPHA